MSEVFKLGKKFTVTQVEKRTGHILSMSEVFKLGKKNTQTQVENRTEHILSTIPKCSNLKKNNN
jgi:hypothetical protein